MKVTGFDNIERFREFSLNKEKGNHSVCYFSFVSNSFDDFSDLINHDVKVMDDNYIMLSGIIKNISFVSGSFENIIKVTVVSKSSCMDSDSNNRIFQKEEQTYKEILENVANKNNYKFEVPASLKEAELVHPIVQNNETDYQFISRLVKEAFGKEIIVDINGEDTINVAFIEESQYSIKTNEIFSISNDIKDSYDEIDFMIKGGEEGQELREFVDIGKQVLWTNKKYVISKVNIKKEEGVFRYKCHAISKDNEVLKREANINNHLYIAKVVEVEDPDNLGRVRLDFSNDIIEDMTQDNKMWVKVLTPYTAKSGGFVFIPDVDDIVETIWDDKEFYVVGCIRQEKLADRYQDIKLKQIGNLHNKNICLAEDKLELTTKEAVITMLDEEIHLSMADSVISVLKDKIDIKTKKSTVRINDDIVADTGKVHIDSDNIEQKVKNKYICESNNITLNASATAKIEGKKKVTIN